MSSRLKSRFGFTLIELLVVILVIAVLIAVAAPSFLGQTKKAQDSVAKQNLSISWKAALSSATSNSTGQGVYPAASVLAGTGPDSVKAGEPSLTVSVGGYSAASSASSPSHIYISSSSTGALYLAFVRSDSGTVWCMSAPSGGQQEIYSGDACSTLGGPPAPTNISPPVISGPPYTGDILTSTSGSWSGSPTSYDYQWYTCSGTDTLTTPISDADTSQYTIEQSSGYIGIRVTATNDGGSTSADSSCIEVLGEAHVPAQLTKPTISGPPYVGYALTVTSNGTWQGGANTPASFTYQWRYSSGGTYDIPGATSNTYTPTADRIGQIVSVVVTAHNGAGQDSGNPSNWSAQVVNPIPEQLTRPTISGLIDGVAYVGQPLTTDIGTWRTTPSVYAPTSYTYQWQYVLASNGSRYDIADATSDTYTPTGDIAGNAVRVVVTAHNPSGSESGNAANQTPYVVNPAPVQLARPTMNVGSGGLVCSGQTLTVTGLGGWQTSPSFYTPDSYSYQWYSTGGLITGATSTSYTATAEDGVNQVSLSVYVTAHNVYGSSSGQSAYWTGYVHRWC